MAPASPLDRVPAPLLVLVAVVSVQVGSAVARTLFAEVGAQGAVLLRVGLSAIVLLAALRPRPWTWGREALLAAAMLGGAMAAMNR